MLLLKNIVIVDQKQQGSERDPCDIPQKIFPKSESLFSIFTRNISSGRYDVNNFTVVSENLISLSF